MGKHTPGPWRWEFNEKHRQLTLVGGNPRYDLTIMEFCRWGMWGAGVSMRDTGPEAEGFNLMYKVHERTDWISAFPGRDHHKNWCAAIDHPDMRLMQAAPDLLDEHEDWSRKFGAALMAVMQEDYGLITELAMSMPFDFSDGGSPTLRSAAIAKAKGEQP